MSLSSNFPTIKPSLNLNFVNVGALDPRITFTRASTATYYNTQTAKAEENLLLQSQNFTTSWTSPNTDVTSDTTLAPDGTTTADTVSDDATNDVHVLSQTIAISGQVTFSVFAKNGSGSRYLTIGVNSDTSNYATATFDLSTQTSTQTLIAGYGGAVTTNVSASAEGFYRYSMTVTTATASNARIGLSNTSTFANFSRGFDRYVGNGSSIILWGAQLEQRSSVTAYTATTTAPITNYIPVLLTAASGVPRFDYDPTTLEAKGLLIEEQRTNIFLYSEQFDDAYWTKSASTVTANAVTAPDGTLTGDKIIADITNANHTVLRSISFTSGTVYTVSCYAKAGEYDYFTLSAGSIATWPARVTFNLISGTVASTVAGTGSIQNIGNGWYRCSVSATATATAATGVNLAASSTGSYVAYTGDGTSGIYIWGAQLEAGAFATSYIPTSTAAVTRSADVASINTLSPWYNAAAGTLYAECSIPFDASTSLFPLIAGFSDGTFNNAITQYERTVDDTRRAVIRVGGSGLFEITNGGTYIYGATSKQALAFAVGDAAFSVNGTAPSTATPASLPTVNIMGLGSTNFLGGSLNMLNGHLRRIAYYPSRLTNAQLQALTS